MFRTIQVGTGRPVSYIVDPNATFQAGMIGQLRVIGNDVVMGVSDGTAPFGIIDDMKDTAFVRPVIDEEVIIEAPVINTDGYQYYLGVNTLGELGNSNLVDSSFVANYSGLSLNPINGTILAPSGSVLNYTSPSSTTPDGIKVRVRYSYYVPNVPGEDSTIGSSRVTIWMSKGIFQTDQFEQVPYAVNATLYVSENGKLTAERTMANQPGVAMCCVPPTSVSPVLEFLWF